MKNFIVGLLAKFLRILRRIILILFLPLNLLIFGRQKQKYCPSSSPQFKPKNKAPNLRMAVAYLPLETFAEIMHFADTDDLNQKMVFVSRAFAALAFPLLRRRFAVRFSDWRKDFKDPIIWPYFKSYLEDQHVLLKEASIQNNHEPILHGAVRIHKNIGGSIDSSSRPGKQKIFDFGDEVFIRWKANEQEDWKIERTLFNANEWRHKEFIFRFPVPVNSNKGSTLEFLIVYNDGQKSYYDCNPQNTVLNKAYTFSPNRQQQPNVFYDFLMAIPGIGSIVQHFWKRDEPINSQHIKFP